MNYKLIKKHTIFATSVKFDVSNRNELNVVAECKAIEDGYFLELNIYFNKRADKDVQIVFESIFRDNVSRYTPDEVKSIVMEVIGYIQQSKLELDIDYSELEKDLIQRISDRFGASEILTIIK
ncbi:MAG: hypothetical protein RLY16_318 [Bacteroidota bacterium]